MTTAVIEKIKTILILILDLWTQFVFYFKINLQPTIDKKFGNKIIHSVLFDILATNWHLTRATTKKIWLAEGRNPFLTISACAFTKITRVHPKKRLDIRRQKSFYFTKLLRKSWISIDASTKTTIRPIKISKKFQFRLQKVEDWNFFQMKLFRIAKIHS